ncbi:MAG: T9SS type A sorting domain-containing protein [Bacteroidia bacterium]
MRNIVALITFLSFLTCSSRLHGQASFTVLGTPYTQNFNSLPNTPDAGDCPWTNNTTITGWYVEESASCPGDACDDVPTIEATCGPLAAAVNNAGGVYVIASSTDRSLGARPAGSSGTCFYGLRILNSTGTTVTSVYVAFYMEQWSIAENSSGPVFNAAPFNNNQVTFDYQTAATVTSLTAGAWTNVAGLTFSQLHNCTLATCTGSSAQRVALDGNLAANRQRMTACITVTIPAGNEIMLRWSDINDGANDHHLQLDDIEVWPFNIACATILPVELIQFGAEKENDRVRLDWSTASENQNAGFFVQRSVDGIRFDNLVWVDGFGTSSELHRYRAYDLNPASGINYYRLRQVDENGTTEYSSPVAVVFEDLNQAIWSAEQRIIFQNNQINAQLEVMDMSGKIVLYKIIDGSGEIDTQDWTEGIYVVRLISGDAILVRKIFVQRATN